MKLSITLKLLKGLCAGREKTTACLAVGACTVLSLCCGIRGGRADCCPVPPDGFDCYVESPAVLPGSGQIATAWYQGTTDMLVGQTPVTRYIAIYHPEVIGLTYEVQYTDDLTTGAWLAYARWKAVTDDIATTFIPIYPCKPARFFRVVAASI